MIKIEYDYSLKRDYSIFVDMPYHLSTKPTYDSYRTTSNSRLVSIEDSGTLYIKRGFTWRDYTYNESLRASLVYFAIWELLNDRCYGAACSNTFKAARKVAGIAYRRINIEDGK